MQIEFFSEMDYKDIFLKILFLWCLSFLNYSAKAADIKNDNLSPTNITANDLWEKANHAFQRHEHAASMDYLEKALSIFGEQQKWNEYVLVLCKIAENLDKLERFEEMKDKAEEAVEDDTSFTRDAQRAD